MTFEDQITRAFETLTERLRGEIDLHVRRASAELHAAAPSFGHSPEPPAPPPAGVASHERVIEGIRAIDGARSLTEILDALLVCAQGDASRAELWLLRSGRLHQWRSPGSEDVGPARVRSLDEGGVLGIATRTNGVAAADGRIAVPIAIAGATVAVLSAESSTGNGEPRAEEIELLTRYAARSLEALTAFMTARALTQRREPDADGASPAGVDAESAEEDTSARRYARLLVSEIRLYHESAVIDGRRDRDLGTRLGGEIARARVMYEQRVPPHVRQRADHFQDELVRTLANGDASLLPVT